MTDIYRAVARAIRDAASADDASVSAHPDFVERAAAAAIRVFHEHVESLPGKNDEYGSQEHAFVLRSDVLALLTEDKQ